MKNTIKPNLQFHSYNRCLSVTLGVVIPMTEKKMRDLIAELQMMLANKVEVRKWRRDRERLTRQLVRARNPVPHKHKWKPLSSDAESSDICICGAEKTILGEIYEHPSRRIV
jgi:hypothetical protein